MTIVPRRRPPAAVLLAALSVAMLALGGCSILPKAEAPTVYRLPSAPGAAAPGEPVAWSLRIDAPQAGDALDSARIAVLPDGDQLTVYKGARWSDSAPALLRDRLFDAFQADGRVRALSIDDNDLQADYVLAGSLRAFQTEYENGQPVVAVRYDAQLVRAGAARILAARRFDVRVPVAGKDVPRVVAAFGRAGDQLAAEVVSWAIDAGRQATASAEARSSGK